MGLDFLDLTFRLEKRFGLKVTLDWLAEELNPLQRPFDFSIGALHGMLCRRLRATGKWPGESAIDEEHPCLQCGFNSWAVAESAACPMCRLGGPYFDRVWQAVARVVSETVGVREDEVTRGSMFVADLGASC